MLVVTPVNMTDCSEMTGLDQAICMALDAHHGDSDKGDAAYIRHPLRLMEEMDTEEERIVAVLHDVVEDSDTELEEINQQFSSEVHDAVAVLTKSEDEDYLEEYIPKIATNPLARKVKKADLKDNLDTTRLDEIEESIVNNLKKYHKSLKKLKNR
jgi:GTP pyrophosphokinase